MDEQLLRLHCGETYVCLRKTLERLVFVHGRSLFGLCDAGKHLQHVAACFGEAMWEDPKQPGWFSRRRKLWKLPHQLRLFAEVCFHILAKSRLSSSQLALSVVLGSHMLQEVIKSTAVKRVLATPKVPLGVPCSVIWDCKDRCKHLKTKHLPTTPEGLSKKVHDSCRCCTSCRGGRCWAA